MAESDESEEEELEVGSCGALGDGFYLLDDWPALSADLTPIENIWALVEHRLWAHYEWTDLQTFKCALRKAWADITGDAALLRKVVGSFDKRRLACIAANGGNIKY